MSDTPNTPPNGDRIPKERLDEVLAEARTLKARLADLEAKANEAEAIRAQLEQEKRQRAADKARHTRERIMDRQGGNLSAPSVQKFFLREYDDLVREQGESAPAFDAWIASDAVRKDPLYSAHFAQPGNPAPQPPPGNPAPPQSQVPPVNPPPADPNRGANPAPPQTTGSVADDRTIEGMLRSRIRNPEMARRLREELAAEGRMTPPPKKS